MGIVYIRAAEAAHHHHFPISPDRRGMREEPANPELDVQLVSITVGIKPARQFETDLVTLRKRIFETAAQKRLEFLVRSKQDVRIEWRGDQRAGIDRAKIGLLRFSDKWDAE